MWTCSQWYVRLFPSISSSSFPWVAAGVLRRQFNIQFLSLEKEEPLCSSNQSSSSVALITFYKQKSSVWLTEEMLWVTVGESFTKTLIGKMFSSSSSPSSSSTHSHIQCTQVNPHIPTSTSIYYGEMESDSLRLWNMPDDVNYDKV